MDRIGAIKDFHRLQARRLILSAPISFWRMARFLVLIFGLCCFLFGFSIGQVRADTIPAIQDSSVVIGTCAGDFTYTGPWTGIESAFETFANVTHGPYVCGSVMGSLAAFVTLSPPTVRYLFDDGYTATYPYTLLSTYTCPSGYTINGTNCDSAAAPPPTCPTGYVLDASGVCVASGSSSALTVAQAAALDWLIANQPDLTASTEVFDSAVGGAFWAFGFVGVLILYFSSHVIGLVLKHVRQG